MAHSRELFKFIENVLMTDIVWICNTVSTESMAVSQTFIDKFIKHGLANPRGEGKFRVGNINLNTLNAACASAAANVFNIVSDLDINDLGLSMIYDKMYQLRPDGAQEVDYSAIKNIKIGSDEAQNYINETLPSLGFGAISCMPLLNYDLYQWFKLNYKNSKKYYPAYLHFNSLCRWMYNQELAYVLSTDSSSVKYVPSFGRAISLNSFTQFSWNKRIESIQLSASPAIKSNQILREYFSKIGPTLDYPMPLLGMWVVNNLPENPRFEDLLDALAKLQESDIIKTIKQYLLSENNFDLERLSREISSEVNYKLKRKINTENSMNIEGIIKLPLLPIQIKLSKKITIDDVKEIGRSLFKHEISTILSGFILNLTLSTEQSNIFKKAKSILTPENNSR